MTRVISRRGNVIAADFRRASPDVRVKAQVLYCDEHVYLARFTLLLDGRVISVEHVTALTPTN